MTASAPAKKTLGVILAGGQSRRMGQDKALLPVGDDNGGGTLLDFMQRKLDATDVFDEIIICRDRESDSVADAKYLPDIIPGLGPIGALYTLSVHYPHRCALVVPVDMPQLAPTLFQSLYKAGLNKSGATYFRDYYFPLLIQFNEKTLSQLAKRVKNNISDRSVGGFLRDIHASALATPKNLSQFANINTVDEWRALKC